MRCIGSFSLNQTDGGALTKTIDSLGEAFDMVEFGVEKTSRLFKVVFDGSGWSVK